MRLYGTNKYDRHGCNLTGNLLIVEYYDDLKKDTEWGQWGRNLCAEYVEKAKKLATESLNKPFKVLLCVPDLVVQVQEEEA